MSYAVQKIYRFDNFTIDPVRRKLLRGEQSVQLPAKAFDLLVVMLENNGRLIEREELFQSLWPGQIVEESNLSVNVSALRKALGERKGQTQYILTIPRQGYRFIADVGIEDVRQNAPHSTPVNDLAATNAEEILLRQHSEYIDEDVADHIKQDRNGAGVPTRVAYLRQRRAIPISQTIIGGLICMLVAAAGFGYWQYNYGDSQDAAVQMGIKRLTLHGNVVRAALSSDGKYFAYVREDKAERSLWLGQTSDGSSMQLRPPSDIVYGSLVFAPDDNSIYCVGTSEGRQHSVLYRMSVLGTKTETVLEHIDSVPAFSPDGQQISFVRQSPEKSESSLLIANAADGKEERVLAVRDWADRFADGISWSPDGNIIAVSANGDSGREMLGVQVNDGAISPLTKQKWNSVHRLAWLRDGSGLVMVATDKPAFEWLQLWHLSYPAGEARRITRDLTTYNQSSLSLSSDDSSLLAVQLQQVNNVWIAPATNLEQARQITSGTPGRLDGAYGLDWTPDGRIFYTAATGEGISIWGMNPDGTGVNPITPSRYVERQLSLTADGRYMVFESDRGGSLEVWRSDLDGGRALQLTTGGKNRAPHIAPDGQWVVYASNRSGSSRIWRVAIDGGAPQQLTDADSEGPSISPDGKQFACFYRPVAGQPWQLAVFSIDGGPPLNLFAMPATANMRNGPRWMPDGSAVTYRDWKEGIWRQPLTGGSPQQIQGLPKEKIYTYAWSRDGSQFAFTRGTESYDVVLISNFR